MNEQELKEKIVGAKERGNKAFHEFFQNELKKAFAGGAKHFGTKDCDKTIYDFEAEALIAAGIGDVSEYKHRAERAERALLWLCDKTMSDITVMVFPSTKTQVQNKQKLYDYCISQAEKELAEERKDD